MYNYAKFSGIVSICGKKYLKMLRSFGFFRVESEVESSLFLSCIFFGLPINFRAYEDTSF